jgi:hypothetical protein
MFLGQSDIVPPIGDTTDCPSDYEYHYSDGMCHYASSGFPGECQPPLVWSNISQDCVIAVGSTGGGASAIPWNYILIGVGALLLLSFAGGRASKGSSKSGRIYSRTTTRTLFA